MPLVTVLNNGTVRVNTKEAFCELIGDFYGEGTYTDALDFICKEINQKHPRVTLDAMKNTRGKWYQWLLAASAWNWAFEHGLAPAALLPNKTQFDIASLYGERLRVFIEDLRAKVLEHAKVALITSNPDFVIIDATGMNLEWPLTRKITSYDPATLETLDGLYTHIIGRCDFRNLLGYMSVKTSFRPDRRLQIPHEGSLMKAIYAHLQTRDWIIKPEGLRYYAAAMSVGPADVEALRTVATHSITTVNEVPKAAVDAVFTVDSEVQAQAMWKSIFRTKN